MPVASDGAPTRAAGSGAAGAAGAAGAGAGNQSLELACTVVIGCGLTGLAVASELSRRGVSTVVVDGLLPQPLRAVADPSSFPERAELLRLLRGYAASHRLDIRSRTSARAVDLVIAGAGLLPAPVPRTRKWAVRTGDGMLLADNVVLTSCPQSELRRLARALGITTGRDLRSALRAIGLYLVGVGESAAPTTRELVCQAKDAGRAIARAVPATAGSGDSSASWQPASA